MTGQFGPYDEFDPNNLVRAASIDAQICSAKQLSNYSDRVQAIKASRLAQERTDEFVRRERDRTEVERYLDNRRLSQIAILVAVVSAVFGVISTVLSAIAVFK